MKRLLFSACFCLIAASSASATPWPDLAQPARATGGGEKDAALLIGIEDYKNLDHVKGARANIEAWDIWLRKTRKVPQTAVIKVLDDDAEADEISDKADAVAGLAKPGGTLWVVFIGHGLPAKDGTEGLLVAQDAKQNAHAYSHSMAQSVLLQKLSVGKQARTVLVLDSCFSGRDRGTELVKGAQPLLVVSKQKLLAKNVTVLTAGKSEEFANQLHGAERPAFSYLMLGALRGWADEDADGKVTVDEALSFTRGALAQHPNVKQTPQVQPATVGGDELARSAGEAAPDLAVLLGKAAAKQAGTPPDCRCLPWGEVDFAWQRAGQTVCSGTGACAAKLNLTANLCADPDQVEGRTWCYTTASCPDAQPSRLPNLVWKWCAAEAAPITVRCPAGTSWNGSGCVGQVVCPAGSEKVDGKCVAKVECPKGTQLVEGHCAAVASSLISNRFRVDAKGETVFDEQSGLRWQRDPPPARYPWNEATLYCLRLILADARWRLPSKDELQTLVKKNQRPTIDQNAFPQSFPNITAFWTSTSVPISGYPVHAWFVDFDNGAVGMAGLENAAQVRCVR